MSNTNQLFNLRDVSWVNGLDQLCTDCLTRDDLVVELGSYTGESTCVFARHCLKVFAVDPWANTYKELIYAGCNSKEVSAYIDRTGVPDMSCVEARFDERTSKHANVCKIKATEESALLTFSDNSIDLVYIDSIHTFEAVTDAINRWTPKLKPGGYLAGHDFDRNVWPGVVKAVLESVGNPMRVYADTSWLVKL